jgi:hypothetical protein
VPTFAYQSPSFITSSAMSDRQLPVTSSDPLARLELGPARLRSQETSAVTSAWGVDWSEELIARDLIQNFFDANRSQLDRITVSAGKNRVRVWAPASFDLRHLFFLGSEKTDTDVGQYGEGFKAATVCILRRQGTSVIAASGKDAVIIRLSDQPAVGTSLYPLVYEFYDLQEQAPGSLLVVEGAWPALCRAVEQGLTHFFHANNALLGERLATQGDAFQLFRSTTDGGHIFYRNLRRGDIPNLPVVLVLNKPCARIEKEVAKDRDRKAFGEPLREIFYSVWASGFFRGRWDALHHVIEAAKPLWEQGSGHPLLAAISRSMYHSWNSVNSVAHFQDRFYAESHSHIPGDTIRFSEIEAEWRRESRIKLPSYFESFGVISACKHLQDLAHAAKAEARRQGARRPTRAENEGITLLRRILSELAPNVARLFDERRTSYTIAATDVLLGELRQGRDYRSREVFLAEHIFAGDFAAALAIFLHEHSHIFGYDGSRGFTDALTETLEVVIRERRLLDQFEAEWNETRKAIARDRKAATKANENDELELLANSGRNELLAILRGLPRDVLRTALRHRTKPSDDDDSE